VTGKRRKKGWGKEKTAGKKKERRWKVILFHHWQTKKGKRSVSIPLRQVTARRKNGSPGKRKEKKKGRESGRCWTIAKKRKGEPGSAVRLLNNERRKEDP